MVYFQRFFSRCSSQVSLRTILIVSITVQVFSTVGLVSYLSFRNGQRAVNDLAQQLQSEIGNRIEQSINNYLQIPRVIAQVNADAVALGHLDLRGRDSLISQFWQQRYLFDTANVTSIYFGSNRGDFLGLGLQGNNQWVVSQVNRSTDNKFHIYSTDKQGNIGQLLEINQYYDPRVRPWYKDTIRGYKPTWSDIYIDFSTQRLAITLGQPIYNEIDALQGIIGVDFSLYHISNFLNQLEIGKSGETFIIDRSGLLVASSTKEKYFYSGNNGKLEQRLQAINSTDTLVSSTAQYLIKKFGNWTEVEENKIFRLTIDGESLLGKVYPFRDSLGLDWLIVIVIPEQDFMAQINANSRATALLSIGALIGSTIIGILIARWITKPLLSLSHAAQELAAGNLDKTVSIQRKDEVGTLANSFNQMAKQLKVSFETLELQNEELQRLDKLKDQFLANTSHELRTPLNGMIGISESMLDGAAGEVSDIQQKNLSMIAHSGHRLSNLVNDILDFSKLRNKNIELQLKPVGIREVVEIVLTLSQSLVGNKDVKLVNAIAYDFPPALADENRLQQILYNLVGNGIKFTDSGSVEVSAQVLEDERIAINVTDTGIGISEDKFELVFQSFEQADGSTAREYGGTGLGLTITKMLVELHQGEITLESSIGIGSRFTFTLPMVSSEQITANIAPEASVNQLPENSPEIDLLASNNETSSPSVVSTSATANALTLANIGTNEEGKFRILIVDDEPVNLQVLNNYLSLRDYIVAQATNGLEAISLLEEGFQPDLVLCDVMMPKMTGYEVTQKIREKWAAHELPVMMLTAKNQISDLVTGLEVGANDYLSKPFHKEELLARVKTHINITHLRTEKEWIRNTFGRYVSDEIVAQLLTSKEALKLGGERKKITIFTSDLRGFTALSERLPPEEVVTILNFYLSRMADVITQYQGTIDEFMGDGILVLFGAPIARADDAIRAVACAVAMQLAMESVNLQIREWGLSPLEMGIGINTGEVVVGNIGSEKRTKYGVVGNQVNLTYRIESYTTGNQIFISESTYREVESIVSLNGQKKVQPKGVKQPITIYEIGGIAGAYNLFLTREEEVFYQLGQPIPLQYTILEGKHVGANLFGGNIIELSAKSAKVSTTQAVEDAMPATLTNIKLNLVTDDNPTTVGDDIYGKVLDKPSEVGSFYLRFTAIPPEVKVKLDNLYHQLQQT